MTEEYWIMILKDEDRLLDNSDRKYRYHCKSLESMSEELAFQERYVVAEESFTMLHGIQNFMDSIQNEKLVLGLHCLTDRQRKAIELHFWEGYQYKEIAEIFSCDPSAVSRLMARALKKLRKHMTDR